MVKNGKITSFYLPRRDLELIDKLAEWGYIIGKSDFARNAIHKAIIEFFEFHDKYEKFHPEEPAPFVLDKHGKRWRILGVSHEVNNNG